MRKTLSIRTRFYGWPAPYRVLQSCVEAVQACTDEIMREQIDVVTSIRFRIHRLQPLVADQGVRAQWRPCPCGLVNR